MTIEEELKGLIKSKYKSVRAFTVGKGLIYGNVDNIFKRSLFSASFQLVSQICCALDLDLNELANNKTLVCIQGNEINNNLSPDQQQLLNNFDQLNNAGQERLIEQLELLNESSKYKKCDTLELGKKQA